MAQMKLSELAAALGGQLEGDGSRLVSGVGPLDAAAAHEVSFLANKRYERHLQATAAAAVLVGADYAGAKPGSAALIRCKDPYFAFRQAMVLFHGFRKAEFEGLSKQASIDPSAVLADGVRVGPFVTISRDSRIGAGSVLYPGVYVGPGCVIGENCTLYANVSLYDGTILHDRVTIHANSSIGQDGFGYATHKGSDGVIRHEKIPQAGIVEVESDVEIGSCCAIERATIGRTVIGAGSKFADLVAIGHGTKLGAHCLLVSQAGIAGSVTAGNYCVFAGQSGVVGHVKLGDGVKVLAQAGVTNDVESGVEMLGSPAIPRSQARRAFLVSQKLPELRNQMQALLREVEQLRERLDQAQQAEGQQ